MASPGGPTLFIPARLSVWLFGLGVWRFTADKSLSQRNFLVKGVDGRRPDTAVPSYSWEYWYRGTTVLACDARVVPVDLAYVIFIDFLAL